MHQSKIILKAMVTRNVRTLLQTPVAKTCKITASASSFVDNVGLGTVLTSMGAENEEYTAAFIDVILSQMVVT